MQIIALADNLHDTLLVGDEYTRRTPFSVGTAVGTQFETRWTFVGLVAEHRFAALASVRRGATTTSLLFDTGLSPGALVTNADRLGVGLSSGR